MNTEPQVEASDLLEVSKDATKVLCGTYVEGIHDIDMAHGGYWVNFMTWFRWDGDDSGYGRSFPNLPRRNQTENIVKVINQAIPIINWYVWKPSWIKVLPPSVFLWTVNSSSSIWEPFTRPNVW